MRTAAALACIPAILVVSGLLGAGCLSGNSTPPGSGLDAGLPSLDGATNTIDATILPIDASAEGGPISIGAVDFGLVGCGTGSASRTYTFTNPEPVAVTYSATIPSGSVFAISGPSSGTVQPGATASITLVASGIPATSKAGATITSTLQLTTSATGSAALSVPLKLTTLGGSLSVSQAVAGFGQVQIGTKATVIPLTITNSGNSPVTVSFGAPQTDGGVDSEFGLVYAGSPSSTTIVANGVAGAGATFLPSSPGAKSVTLAMQTNDPLCASQAGSIAMSGTGSTAQVNVGPDPLQFGSVVCGQTGSALQVTITNGSPSAINFSDSLGMGASSPFTVDVSSGTVAAQNGDAGVAIITVTPKAIPFPGNVAPGAYNDTLVVTPVSPFVSPTTITLQESASGAILTLNMDGGTDFGSVDPGQSPSLPFSVTNTGNVDAPLTVSVTGSGYDAGFVGDAGVAEAGGGAASGNVYFVPTAGGSDPGTVSISTTAPLCAALPSANLTAVAAVPVATYASAPVAPTATCNGTTTQASLQISNTGAAPLTISNAASKNGTFTIVSSPASPIGVGSNDSIVIQPVAIGQGTAGGSSINDTLTFQTNEPGNPTRSASVGTTVMGANLVFTGLSSGAALITTPACGTIDYAVKNTGNMDAVVVATGSYPSIQDTGGSKSTVFQFGGVFGTPQLVSAGSQVTDSLGTPLGECANVSSCTPQATEPFATTDTSDAGTQIGVCVPLATLTVELNYCACFPQGC
jgi:hypothetical protein